MESYSEDRKVMGFRPGGSCNLSPLIDKLLSYGKGKWNNKYIPCGVVMRNK